MKLYATSRNKSTSKGIGDDNMIVIELNKGNTRTATIKYTQEQEYPKLEILLNGVWFDVKVKRE